MGCLHLMLTRLNMFVHVTVGQGIISIVEEARSSVCLEWLGRGRGGGGILVLLNSHKVDFHLSVCPREYSDHFKG